MQRERLSSRLGFILLSAGCAIGIGNVWKFPWMAGQYGGGIFVLIYLFFLAIMGIPVMTMEFAMGRASQKSAAHIYRPLEKKGSKWHLHGYFCMAGSYILMMFYVVVSGWMLNYFISTASGKFNGMSSEQVAGAFNELTSSPVEMIIYTVIVVALGFFICSFSLQKGLERISKYMMIALLAIMVFLAINSFFMDGSRDGLAFYLIPDFSKLDSFDKVINVISGAMQQAFFTLSLGMGSMAIFGSYLGKDRSLMGESINIAVLDTFVAITSGLIIFPACFTYGVEVTAGPPLIFVTLPNVFNSMSAPFGQILGTLFFLFMTFAAFSTVIAVFQLIIACCEDTFGWSKKKACLINAIALTVLSLPCIFGFNLIPQFDFFGKVVNVLDIEDFAVSNLLLPFGSLLFAVFCTSRYGWGFKNFQAEANSGKGLKVPTWMRGYLAYVLPVIILATFIFGIISFFK